MRRMLVSKPQSATPRSSQPMATPRLRRRYWTLLTALLALSALFAFGLLAWDNTMPIGLSLIHISDPTRPY